MSEECIFCRIARKEVPTQPIYEDHDLIAFADIHPVAPVHVLIVPKEHMVNLNEAGKNDVPVLGKALRLAAKIADEKGVAESGYRVVVNNGEQGGQVVPHLHLHLIGGRALDPKMG
jgi:histidine triad (HIT) family protein